MKTKILLFGAFLALTFFISCDSNEKNQDSMTNSNISNEEIVVDSKIDASIDDVSAIAEEQYGVQQNMASKSGETIKSFLPDCVTITTTLTDGTWTRTIDFGTEGCALLNGSVLKGKIIISFSNNFTSSEQTISYSFDNFFHNGKKLHGSKTIIRSLKSTDLLATVHPVYTNTVDMTITFEDGKIYTRTGTRIREMVEGFDTMANWEDNVFLVTGNGITTMPNGDKITTEIIIPLRFTMACKLPFPVKGSISITKNEAEALIDFGNGECDKLATVTKDGVTTEITL